MMSLNQAKSEKPAYAEMHRNSPPHFFVQELVDHDIRKMGNPRTFLVANSKANGQDVSKVV